MVRLLIGLVLLGFVAAAWIGGMEKFYDDETFVSAETKKTIKETLMVTDDHRQELNRSTRITDEVAFGLLGLFAGAVIGGCTGRFSTNSNLVKASVTGALLGGLTGASAGYIGHTFQMHAHFFDNATVHAVVRLIAMFLPFAIAMGLAAALSGILKRDISDAIVGSILGLLIGATVYGLASDAFAGARENDTDIMPHHFRNKVLLVSLVTMLIALLISTQMLRKPKSEPA